MPSNREVTVIHGSKQSWVRLQLAPVAPRENDRMPSLIISMTRQKGKNRVGFSIALSVGEALLLGDRLTLKYHKWPQGGIFHKFQQQHIKKLDVRDTEQGTFIVLSGGSGEGNRVALKLEPHESRLVAETCYIWAKKVLGARMVVDEQ